MRPTVDGFKNVDLLWQLLPIELKLRLNEVDLQLLPRTAMKGLVCGFRLLAQGRIVLSKEATNTALRDGKLSGQTIRLRIVAKDLSRYSTITADSAEEVL